MARSLSDEVEAALEVAPVLGVLRADPRRRLERASRVVVLSAGQSLWGIGAPATHVGLVLAGRLKLTRASAAREVIVDVAVPGDLLGAVGFALAGRHLTAPVCLRRARVLLIPAALLRSLLDQQVEATAAMSHDLARQVRRLQELVEGLSAGGVAQRLANVLVGLVERAGEPFPGGHLIPLRLRRADLASMAATTIESSSRCISRWQREGWVAPQPAGYLVRDLPALRRVALGLG